MLHMLKRRGVYAAAALALALAASQAHAVPANPKSHTFTQPDGTRFTGQLQGDEWFNWYRTQDGKVFVRNPKTKAFEFAKLTVVNGERKLVSTGVKVRAGMTASSASSIKDATLFQIAANAQARAGIKREGINKPLAGQTGEARFATMAAPSHNYNTLIIAVEFTDTQLTSPISTWSNKIFGTNFGQLKHYYNEISYGKVSLVPAPESEGTVNDGFVRVQLNYPHPNPRDDHWATRALLRDALIQANAKVNFAAFDTDGNSTLSVKELQIGFVVAGPEAAIWSNEGGIWAHAWYFPDAPVLDGVTVGSDAQHYFCWGERHEYGASDVFDATIGVIAHEMGHSAFHLPDLYPNLGYWDLMATGAWGRRADEFQQGMRPTQMTAHSKWKAGFIDATYVDPMYAGSTRTLYKSLSSTPNVLITENPSNSAHYFALEHRRIEGYDQGMTGYAAEDNRSGVLVLHESGDWQGLTLVKANDDPLNITSNLFYPGNKDRLAPDTTPSTNDPTNGTSTGFIFENIAYSGDTMTLKASRAATVPGAACKLYTSANSAHVTAGRAYTVVTGTWIKTTTYYAVGSQQSLGTVATTQNTLKEDPTGYFVKGGTCPAQNSPQFSDVLYYGNGSNTLLSAIVTDIENDVVRVELELDGSGVWQRLRTSYQDAGSQWALNHTISGLAEGQHTFWLRATDAGDRQTLFGPIQFTVVGPRAPTCTINRVHRDSEGYYTAWGDFTDLDGGVVNVDVSLDNGAWLPATVSWEWTRRLSQQPNDLANGLHTVNARATDETGLTGSCGPFQLEVGVEHAPTATIGGVYVYADIVNLDGTANDIDGDLTGVEVEFDGNGQWQLVENFGLENPTAASWYLQKTGVSPGSYTVRARAVDAGGRRSAPTAATSFQVAAPQAPTCSINEIRTEGDYTLAVGSVTDVNNDAQLVESYMIDIGEWQPTMYMGGEEVTVVLSQQPLAAGSYTAQMRVQDSRGVYGNCTKAFSVGAAPQIGTITAQASGMSVTASGTASDADNDLARVEVQYDSETGPWIAATGTTTWSHTNNSLTAGNHRVRARAIDASSQTSAESAWTSFSLSSVSCFTAVNSAHASAGRATLKYVNLYYANGSNTYLGVATDTTSLQQQAANHWVKVTSCP